MFCVTKSLDPNFDAFPALQTWRAQARDDQWPPDGDWLIWLLLGGRGAGKTRAGAEWVRAQVQAGCRRVALVAPTLGDAREVMIDGESGLLAIGPLSERPHYTASRRRLEWPNGAVGMVFSSEDPDGLRGPQFDAAWADEFCAWSYPDETLSNLRLALRLGTRPRLVITTTPRPIPSLKAVMQTAGVVIGRAKTSDNTDNLSSVFIEAVHAQYGGTRLGRQELDGEILDDLSGALWSRATIEACRTDPPQHFDTVIVAIDPPVTSGLRSDACGIIVAGVVRGDTRGGSQVYVLHDGTVQGESPEGWARRAVSLWTDFDADYMLAEVNQGGEMVASVINTVAPDALVKTVYASRGKAARAEPVAALYEQGRVHHVRAFPDLEDELCAMGSATTRRKSPDRADALVWAVTDLLLSRRSAPRIRQP